MNKYLLTTFFLLILTISKAQTKFQRSFGGGSDNRAWSVQITTDGGFVIAGFTGTYGAGDLDVYLIKLNSIGDTLWTRTFGGIDEEEGRCVRETSDGGFIIAGMTRSFGSGSFDVYIVKTDPSGNLMWSKTYGGTNYDGAQSIIETSDGGYAIIGYTTSFGTNGSAVYLLKTDAAGSLLWSKTYDEDIYQTGCSILQTADGGYTILGSTESLIIGPFSGHDVLLMKIDPFGNLLWSKTYGGNEDDSGLSLQQTSDGGYILAGNSASFSGSFNGTDIYLIKTDATGDTLWTKTYGTTLLDDAAYSVIETTDGGYAVSGYSFSSNYNAILIKSNSIGDTLWTKKYTGFINSIFYDLKQTQDGGFLLSGYGGVLGVGNTIYLVKTDGNGESGCNESNDPILINLPATQVYSPTLIVSLGGTSSIPPTLISSGGESTIHCLSTGINDFSVFNSMVIFPNPATDQLTIESKYSGPILIYDFLGQLVGRYEKTVEDLTIDVSGYSAGMYLMKIKSGSGFKFSVY